MKKKDIFLTIGIVIFLITWMFDLFIKNIPDILETIIYIICIIFLLLHYILDEHFKNLVKSLNIKQKVLFIILIITNIILLGFININTEFILFLLLIIFDYIIGNLILKYVK